VNVMSSQAFWLVGVLVVFIGSCCADSFADAPQSARSEIQSQYDMSNAAASKGDVEGMLSKCAPDFTVIPLEGKTKDLASLRIRLGVITGFSSLKNSTTIENVKLQDDGVVVEVSESLTVVTAGASQTSKFTFVYHCRDFWIHTPSGWREKRSRLLSSKSPDAATPDSVGLFHW